MEPLSKEGASHGLKLDTEKASQAEVTGWIQENEEHLPIMMLMMFEIHSEAVELFSNPSQRPKELYLANFAFAYQQLVQKMFESDMGSGLNLSEMVKSSWQVAKTYVRATTNVAQIRDHLQLRCDVKDWD